MHDQEGIVRYVGKTSKTLAKRLKKHRQDARAGNQAYRCRWMRKLLNQGYKPTIHLLETVEGNGSEQEKQWIAFYRQVGIKPLTNVTDGGEGTAGFVPTAEHRDKISRALTGLKRSEETKALVREARAKQWQPAHRVPHSEETRVKIRQTLADPIVREKIGAANRGRKRTPEEIDKWRQSFFANRKKAVSFVLTG